jgi:lipid-A-disaccharide synthase
MATEIGLQAMATEAGAPPLIFLIAGEPSGDVLGGALMVALRRRLGGAVRFAGIGGERMAAEGLTSLVPIEELAIMGIAEVLPRVRNILRRVRETAERIIQLEPACVVTIDSSGFTWRVAKLLRERGETLPLIHYVAPMVWAWRAYNARKVARWYNHLMALLPFEPPYFTAVGLACSYVGHPIIESGADRGDGDGFRRRHGIAPAETILCLLPGSRRGEVRRLLPIFGAALQRILPQHPGLRLVLPTLSHVAPLVRDFTAGWPVPVTILEGRDGKYDAFAASTVALAASGTVALELAMAELPAIITYRTNPVTAWWLRRVVKAPYANLVNLILGRLVVPELLLEECTPERISSALNELLGVADSRAAQIEGYRACLEQLGRGDLSPSLRAADQVLAVMTAGPRWTKRPA